MPHDRVCVAQIGAPHGVRGEVRLWVYTEDPAAITRYGPLESEDGARRFEIATMRPAKRCFVARLRGIDDRSGAERLTNLRLYVPRDRLPPPDEAETYYHADLVGLTAVDRHGATLGTVLAVQNFGAGDLLEIAPERGGPSVLLPFTQQAVPVVDVGAGRLVVDVPDGLVDEQAVED